MRPRKTVLRIALLAVALACALPSLAAEPEQQPEPTQAEVDRAYRAHVDRLNEGSLKYFGEETAKKYLVEVHDVKKVECKRENATTFRCQISVTATTMGTESVDRPGDVRLTHGPPGWTLEVVKAQAQAPHK